MKHHKIPADRIVKIPHYLTPSLPVRGEFTRFTTAAPMDIWNVPTLNVVALHCLCHDKRAQARAELIRRYEVLQ